MWVCLFFILHDIFVFLCTPQRIRPGSYFGSLAGNLHVVLSQVPKKHHFFVFPKPSIIFFWRFPPKFNLFKLKFPMFLFHIFSKHCNCHYSCVPKQGSAISQGLFFAAWCFAPLGGVKVGWFYFWISFAQSAWGGVLFRGTCLDI